MKLNNQHELPEIILDIIDYAKSLYSKGDSQYTPSSLNMPPQMFQLMSEHRKELEGDYSEQLASLLGTSFHDLAERAMLTFPDKYVPEERYFMDFEMPDGTTRRISGQIDVYDKRNQHLYDFKVTSIFKAKKPEPDPEWCNQGSVNKYIMFHNGVKVKGATNLVYAKDFRRGEARLRQDYPPTPIVPVPLTLMNKKDTEKWIIDRIQQHESDVPRPCSDEERWADAPSFAVMKNKAKRATKVFDNESDANKHAEELQAKVKPDSKDKYWVEKRAGNLWRRCDNYCPVADWCPQYKASKQVDLGKVNDEFEGWGD